MPAALRPCIDAAGKANAPSMRVAFERRPYEDVEITAPVCIRLMKVHAMAAFDDEFLRARGPGRAGSNFSRGFMT